MYAHSSRARNAVQDVGCTFGGPVLNWHDCQVMDYAQAGCPQRLAQGVSLGGGGHQERQHWQLWMQQGILQTQTARADACLSAEPPCQTAHKAALNLITWPVTEDRQAIQAFRLEWTRGAQAGIWGGVYTCL
jgi:hypothetical protein